MKGYNKLKREVLELLKPQLPEELYFPSINHTRNLLKISSKYLRSKNIAGYDAKLVRLALLLHYVGFTVTTLDHEETGKRIAGDLMNKYRKDIVFVQNLILATRIPQTPGTILEKVICDCDLDYLGRKPSYCAQPRSRNTYL